jgi:hypothetical protein
LMCAIRDVKRDARRMELVQFLVQHEADVNMANVRHFLRVSRPSPRPFCLAFTSLGRLAVVLAVPRGCI